MAEQEATATDAAPAVAPAPADAPAPAPAPAAAPAPQPAAPTSQDAEEEPAPKKKEVPLIVLERVGEKKNLDDVSEDELKAILKEYYDRWVASESEVFDIAHDVKVKDMQIHELEMEVSDMRGKFIIPKLKKVHNFRLTADD